MTRTIIGLMVATALLAACDRDETEQDPSPAASEAATSESEAAASPSETSPSPDASSPTASQSPSSATGDAELDAIFVDLPAPYEYGEVPRELEGQLEALSGAPGIDSVGGQGVYVDGEPAAFVMAATWAVDTTDEDRQAALDGFAEGSGLTLERFMLNGKDAFRAQKEGVQFVVFIGADFLLVTIGGDRAQVEEVAGAIVAAV